MSLAETRRIIWQKCWDMFSWQEGDEFGMDFVSDEINPATGMEWTLEEFMEYALKLYGEAIIKKR